MKKHIVLVLLVPILALTLISCDADMRSSFASFLGGLGGNVYIDGGLVEANKADVKAAAATIAGLGSGSGTATVTEGSDTEDFGIKVTVPVGVTSVMKPQPKADQDKLKDDLANALNSPQQTAELKEELKKPVTGTRRDAVQGTVEVFNATVDKLVAAIGPGNEELQSTLQKLALDPIDPADSGITEGDVLLVQMMTNLISNTIETIKSTTTSGKVEDVSDEGLAKPENKDKVLAIIDDALFTAKIAEELSGSASIDFSGQLDLANLMDSLNRSSRTSRDGNDDFDMSDFIGSINNLGPDLVKMFGLKKQSDGTYNWESGGYRRFISTQQAYRGAVEHALKFSSKSGQALKSKADSLVFDGSTAIKYLLAVAVTEMHEWGKPDKPSEENHGRVIIRTIISDNSWIATGSGTDTTTWIEPNVTGIKFEDFGKALYGKGEVYLKTIFENTQTINEVGGITQLSTAINDFLTKTDGDGKTDFDKWFADLK